MKRKTKKESKMVTPDDELDGCAEFCRRLFTYVGSTSTVDLLQEVERRLVFRVPGQEATPEDVRALNHVRAAQMWLRKRQQ